ncbi:hypothetical protein SH139x_002577 [Planctomycetaceae bacterium SH139]
MSTSKANSLYIPKVTEHERHLSIDYSRINPQTCTLIHEQSYRQAYDALSLFPHSKVVAHARGFCALRAGLISEAVNIFRGICLNPGTTVVRFDTEDALRINYATAILLAGSPCGALDILFDVQNRQSAAVMAIENSIDGWAKQLSFWRWLDWKINRIDPPSACVPLAFAPGVMPCECLVQASSCQAPLKNFVDLQPITGATVATISR